VSRTLFRMSLVMVVRRVQCESHTAQHTTYDTNINQAHSKQRATHTHNTRHAATAPKLT